eukprot:354275-Chlamydomonas_euryale.AAC.3
MARGSAHHQQRMARGSSNRQQCVARIGAHQQLMAGWGIVCSPPTGKQGQSTQALLLAGRGPR